MYRAWRYGSSNGSPVSVVLEKPGAAEQVAVFVIAGRKLEAGRRDDVVQLPDQDRVEGIDEVPEGCGKGADPAWLYRLAAGGQGEISHRRA